MNRDIKRLLGNITSLGLTRGLEYLIPLITLPYLINTLGVELYGLIDYALALALYFGAVMSYGFSVTAVRRIALARNDRNRVAEIVGETVGAIGLLIAASALIYFSIVSVVPGFRQNGALYVVAFLQTTVQSLFPIWYFRGIEKLSVSAGLMTGARASYLVSIFLFVKGPSDYVLVPALNAVAIGAATFLAYRLIVRHTGLRLQMPSWRQLSAVYRDSFDAFLAQLTPNLYNNSATFLLGAFAGPSAVGTFSAARKVVEMLSSIGMIVSNALFPYLLRNPSKVRVAHNVLWGLGLAVCLTGILAADLVIALLFPDVDQPLAIYMRWLCLGILGYFGNVIYHTNGLMLLSRDDLVRRISVISSLLFLGVGLISVPYWGIYGSILMIVGARLLMSIMGLIYFRIATRSTGSNV